MSIDFAICDPCCGAETTKLRHTTEGAHMHTPDTRSRMRFLLVGLATVPVALSLAGPAGASERFCVTDTDGRKIICVGE